MDIKETVSRQWVRRLLHDMGYSFKKTTIASKDIDPSDLVKFRDNLNRKIRWVMNEYSIPWTRVINLDQTSVRLLPTSDFSWSPCGEKKALPADKLTQTTVVLAVGTEVGTLMTQIIFTGKTPRVLTCAPAPEDCEVTHTHNHWSSAETMQLLLKQIDAKLNADTPQKPWLCLLDLCSVHTSVAFRKWVHEDAGWIKLVFIAAGTTGELQPLDRSFMRSFKEKLRAQTAMHFAETVLAGECGTIKDEMQKRILKQTLVYHVLLIFGVFPYLC